MKVLNEFKYLYCNLGLTLEKGDVDGKLLNYKYLTHIDLVYISKVIRLMILLLVHRMHPQMEINLVSSEYCFQRKNVISN